MSDAREELARKHADLISENLRYGVGLTKADADMAGRALVKFGFCLRADALEVAAKIADEEAIRQHKISQLTVHVEKLAAIETKRACELMAANIRALAVSQKE